MKYNGLDGGWNWSEFWVGIYFPFAVVITLVATWTIIKWLLHFGSKAAVNLSLRTNSKATNKQRAHFGALAYSAKRAKYFVFGNMAFAVIIGMDSARFKKGLSALDPPVKLNSLFPDRRARMLTDEFFASWDRQNDPHGYGAMKTALEEVEKDAES